MNGVIHHQIGSSHGVRTARCGAEGRDLVVSGWTLEVDCPDCIALTEAQRPKDTP